jgi:hypothetical protein
MAQKSDKRPTDKQIDNAKEAIELLFATNYISEKKLYKENFFRGVFFGLGTLVGTIIVITALLWILSLLDSVPLIGPVIDNLEQTIEQAEKTR